MLDFCADAAHARRVYGARREAPANRHQEARQRRGKVPGLRKVSPLQRARVPHLTEHLHTGEIQV